MTQVRGSVYIWVTWLSSLLVGDRSCEWATWFRAHFMRYDKAPSDFDLATWKMDHTQLLNELCDELETAGCTVSIEDQNWFKTAGSSGAVIAGKPDIIAEDTDGRVTVYDVKTGAERASDVAQMMIYMYALPLAQGSRWKNRTVGGCLVYGDGSRKPIPASAINERFRKNLFALLCRVAAEGPARQVPSERECSWCDLTIADCPERIERDVA